MKFKSSRSYLIFFSLLKESFLFAIHALKANKLRTTLSLLGITIGIFAIITVFTVMDALESNIRSSLSGLGDDVIYIDKFSWKPDPNYPLWKYMSRPSFQLKDMNELKQRIHTADAVSFAVGFGGTIKYKTNSVDNVTVQAGTFDFNRTYSMEIEQGRYFTEHEVISGRNVAIIGAKVAEALFDRNTPAIGQDIKMNGIKLRVIGVLKKTGESIFETGTDSRMIITYPYVHHFLDINSGNFSPIIAVKAKPMISNEELKSELVSVLRSVRRIKPSEEDNFALNEKSVFNDLLDNLFAVVDMVGWVVGIFSILIGGFSIANIMFVSVKERTQQIGIQKSLGAKNYFILLQFLVESIILSLIGGALGLTIIFLFLLVAGDSFGFKIELTAVNALMGLNISILIGIVSGFVPSYSASQLDPVEAMRSNG